MTDPLRAPGSHGALIRRELISTRVGQLHVRLCTPASEARADPRWRFEAGDQAVPLVLLHMTPLSSAMYDPLLPRFGADRPTIAPDRAGFGFSDLPTGPLSITEYAQATLDVVDGLGIDRFDVLGTHTGSVEAIELASVHPNRVRKVTLISIPAYAPDELEQRQYRLAGVPPPAEDGAHLQWHWQRRFLYRTPPYDLALFHWRLLQELLAGASVWWPYRAVFDYPTAERLAGLSQPVLVLAPHDDLWEQTERVYRSGGLPPRAHFVDLPHLGLDIAYFASDEVAGLVRQFLDGE